MESESEVLKPCPFCGSDSTEVYAVEPFYTGSTLFQAGCLDCRAGIGRFDTREWAIKAWNRRAGDE